MASKLLEAWTKLWHTDKCDNLFLVVFDLALNIFKIHLFNIFKIFYKIYYMGCLFAKKNKKLLKDS